MEVVSLGVSSKGARANCGMVMIMVMVMVEKAVNRRDPDRNGDKQQQIDHPIAAVVIKGRDQLSLHHHLHTLSLTTTSAQTVHHVYRHPR